MPGEYVSKEVCDERFDRILDSQKKIEIKFDNMTVILSEIKTQFGVFLAGREPILKRLDAIEEQHKGEAVAEVKELKGLPDRRTVDRRWRIAIVITIAFSLWGAILGVFNLAEKVKAVSNANTQSNVTQQTTPNP